MVRDVTKVTLWGSHGTVPLRPLNRITKWVFMLCSALGRQLTIYELGVVLIRVFTRAGPLISLRRTATVTEIEFENQNHQDLLYYCGTISTMYIFTCL